jgi:hypothetical protein
MAEYISGWIIMQGRTGGRSEGRTVAAVGTVGCRKILDV